MPAAAMSANSLQRKLGDVRGACRIRHRSVGVHGIRCGRKPDRYSLQRIGTGRQCRRPVVRAIGRQGLLPRIQVEPMTGQRGWLHIKPRAGGWLAAACLSSWACGDSGSMRVSPLEAPSAGAPQSADPALAVEPGSGDLVLGWIEGDGQVWGLYTARSSDGGVHWSPPVHVAGGAGAPGEIHPHGESSPRLVIAREAGWRWCGPAVTRSPAGSGCDNAPLCAIR